MVPNVQARSLAEFLWKGAHSQDYHRGRRGPRPLRRTSSDDQWGKGEQAGSGRDLGPLPES